MFGHLQVKSAYSFQSSTILIKDLVALAASKQIDALALCDQDNMFGAFEFYEACQSAGIKPIFGVEATVKIEDEKYPFTLLAQDDVGYFDLVRIVSDINTNEDRCLTMEGLAVYKEHLFIISASREGIIQRLIEKEMETEAEKYLRLFKETFKDYYYVMIQDHGLAMQKTMNERLIALAKYVGVKVLCSNDVCYLKPQDAIAVDLMQASSEDRVLDAKYQPLTNQRYLKNRGEMENLFPPDILANTEEVLNRCKASIPHDAKNLPNYPTPKNAPKQDYLRSLCVVGLKKRFKGKEIPEKYKERLTYELKVIHSMGFDDYFLIVWDYVRFAKINHILVGPGRGSAAGSLVAYVLGITNVDPLAFDLLFERFLNPERVSMPDIDIDFQDDRRDEVVQYVISKYGQDHVAQIVTFSTYGPRVAIKDIGKVMGLPLPRLEMIAKMVPTGYKNKKTITQMYETSASFQSQINQNPILRSLIAPMSLIEHLPRNISMHAAGVVLSTKPLREIVPLVIGPSEMIMSQYSKDYIEKAGLLKMDFLGLKNLTMISYILKDIEDDLGIEIKPNDLPLDDAKTYQMLSRADTFGVFQLESTGMRSLLRRMKPYCFNDIVDAIALYRPGPMENIPLYLERRGHGEKIDFIVPELKDILSSTSGIIIYQEQIMQIATVVANFSLGKADVLRKGVSKKNSETLNKMKEEFIQGAIENHYTKEKAEEIYALIEKFANYGFNKSHSVAYAYVAYQLAYLKANYPLYFFASILSNEGASTTTKLHCIEESKHYNVAILSPSVNASQGRFTVEQGSIRYSLLSIKNVGFAGYQMIIEERKKGKFKDMYDFLGRMESSRLSSKMIESLIDAGAFDEFETNRAFLKANLETMNEYVHLRNTIGVDEPPILKDVKENRYRKLEDEKEVLGIYLSTHPIVFIKEKLPGKVINLSDVEEYQNREIPVVMTITKVKTIVDKRGNEMAFVEGNDETSNRECICFSSQYGSFKSSLERGNTVLMNVRVQVKDQVSLIINNVREIGES